MASMALSASCAVLQIHAEPAPDSVAQSPGYCGSATVSQALANLGVDADKTRKAVKLLDFLADRRHGLNSLAELRNVARDAGVHAEAFKVKPDALPHLAKQGELIVNVTGNLHFALIERIDAESVTLYIPELHFQHPQFRRKEFLGSWDGVALLLANDEPELTGRQKEVALMPDEELKRIFGGQNCTNVPAVRSQVTVGNRTVNDNKGNEPGRSEVPSDEGNSGKDKKTEDPIVIVNGNMTLTNEDIAVPTRGLPLQLTRYYNAQTVSEVPGWNPEPGAGSWAVEGGEYSGQGDRSASDLVLRDFELELDMRTVEPGRYHTWETAWVNFRYQPHPDNPRFPFNAYCVLIHTDGIVELSKITNGVKWVEQNARGKFPIKVRPHKRLHPTTQNRVKIKAQGRRITVSVNGDVVITYVDNDRPILNKGSIALESYFCHAHFDNIHIKADNGRTYRYTFDSDDNQFIFGYGWTHSYSLRIKEHPNHLTLYRENNHKERYVHTGNGRYKPVRAGSYSQLTKDTAGFSLRTKYGIHYRFDLDGILQYVEDRNKNCTSLAYTQRGGKPFLASITGPADRRIRLEYGENDMVTKAVDPTGNEVLYHYDTDKHLVKVTDREANETRYAYHPHNHNITKVTDPMGNEYGYEYGYNDRVIHQTDPLRNKTTFDYCWQDIFIINCFTPVHIGSEDSWKYDRTRAYKYRFDTNGYVSAITYPKPTKWEQPSTVQMQNDKNGNVTHLWDQNGKTTGFTYDDRGNITGIVDAAGTRTRVEYNTTYSFPTAIVVVDSKGKTVRTTSFAYDARGNLIQVTDSEDAVTKLECNVHGQLVAVTDPEGRKVRIEYDEFGHPAAILDILDQAVRFTCDVLGRPTRVTDAKGNFATLEYDKNGNVKSVTDPLGNKTEYKYTKNGDLASVTDPLDNTTQFVYDCFGNPKSITDAKGNTTRFIYDTANQLHLGVSNLRQIIDANGNPTTYEYDQLDRLRMVTDAAGQSYRLDYDTRGNLVKRTDPAGKATQYGYDALSRLVQIQYPDSTAVRRWFDVAGNLVALRDTTGTSGFKYNKSGRLISRIYPDGTTFGYSYDKSGRRTAMSITGFGKVAYHYDSLGRLSRMTLPDGGKFDFAYDALSRRTALKYPNGTRATYAYDAASRLTELVNLAKNGKPMSRFAYTYDKASRRTRVDWLNGHAEYKYDILGQLIRESGTLAGKDFFSDFEYDPLGNRLSLKEPDSTTKYVYNKLNQLTQLTRSNGEMVTFGYDARGNLVRRAVGNQVEKFGYNSNNRMTTFALPVRAVRASYRYGGLGQRIEKTVNGEVATYYHDLDELAITKRGQRRVDFVLGPGMDEILYDSHGQCYHHDGLGSAVNASNPSGKSVAHFAYNAFGQHRELGGRIGDTWSFGSRQHDRESGLYYYRHRYYDQGLGRYTSPDPLGSLDGVNHYVYVKNDPVNYIDPLGLCRKRYQQRMEFIDEAEKEFKRKRGPIWSALARYLILPALRSGVRTAHEAEETGIDEETAWKLGTTKGISDAVFKEAMLNVTIFSALGAEISIGKDARIALLGNRTSNKLGRWPHYHRRVTGPGGETRPGQGIGRKRPFETKSTDKSFLDRF